MIWCCPRCRGQLIEAHAGVRCSSCRSFYERIGGILDLRIQGAGSFDCRADTERAKSLLAAIPNPSANDLITRVFSAGGEWDEAWAESRRRRVLSSTESLRRELRGWLHAAMVSPLLDLGCGAGSLLVAAAREDLQGIGIDVSLTLLLIAQQLILEEGGQPVVAAAFAEALPLGDSSVSAVISLDVIEHVNDPESYLVEAGRVLRPGGVAAFSTPNRYSLTKEPHVGVWGVGWLPRDLQKPFVRIRNGKKYEGTFLLSTWQAARLVRRSMDSDRVEVLIPTVSQEEVLSFPPWRAALARLYNRLVLRSWTKRIFLLVGPFFRIVAIKGQRDQPEPLPQSV